jgi:hypothetical protein
LVGPFRFVSLARSGISEPRERFENIEIAARESETEGRVNLVREKAG